ncbi:neurofilament heavy polypeptide-like [Centruroides sculpturatus]|nr:neurofilament heavy polypeptide-like [Centruroides sculpturatus]
MIQNMTAQLKDTSKELQDKETELSQVRLNYCKSLQEVDILYEKYDWLKLKLNMCEEDLKEEKKKNTQNIDQEDNLLERDNYLNEEEESDLEEELQLSSKSCKSKSRTPESKSDLKRKITPKKNVTPAKSPQQKVSSENVSPSMNLKTEKLKCSYFPPVKHSQPIAEEKKMNTSKINTRTSKRTQIQPPVEKRTYNKIKDSCSDDKETKENKCPQNECSKRSEAVSKQNAQKDSPVNKKLKTLNKLPITRGLSKGPPPELSKKPLFPPLNKQSELKATCSKSSNLKKLDEKQSELSSESTDEGNQEECKIQ